MHTGFFPVLNTGKTPLRLSFKLTMFDLLYLRYKELQKSLISDFV